MHLEDYRVFVSTSMQTHMLARCPSLKELQLNASPARLLHKQFVGDRYAWRQGLPIGFFDTKINRENLLCCMTRPTPSLIANALSNLDSMRCAELKRYVLADTTNTEDPCPAQCQHQAQA